MHLGHRLHCRYTTLSLSSFNYIHASLTLQVHDAITYAGTVVEQLLIVMFPTKIAVHHFPVLCVRQSFPIVNPLRRGALLRERWARAKEFEAGALFQESEVQHLTCCFA